MLLEKRKIKSSGFINISACILLVLPVAGEWRSDEPISGTCYGLFLEPTQCHRMMFGA